jgi:type VI secretion system protein ImpL
MQPLAILLSRWFVTFIGTAILAGLIWFFGPLLSQAEDSQIRFALIVATLLIWAGVNLLLDAQRKHRDLTLAEGATASIVGSAPPLATNEEAEALRNRLKTALRSFKQTLRSRGYLYELPWYVIIGPPGAGKTTALLNAGLKFPLATEMGEGAVAGVGGTRLCDWWFTEDAVLIDTAGRYTTQDSDASVDRAGWEAFLDLLKRTRPREPLNGVIVAFPLSEIALAPASKRLAHAGAIRRRIKELEARLLVRVPVYAVFTKADLVAGFTEFFDDLDREARAQIWGATFPLSSGEGESIETFAKEFRSLVERLNMRLLDRLHRERNLDRRALIAMFPDQIASLKQPLLDFLQRTFGRSSSDPAPFLRGIYLTSGTQEGTPIDRLNRTLSQTFGVDQADAPSLRAKHGRSYFLERLLRELIFGEAILVSHETGVMRRHVTWRAIVVAICSLALLAVGASLWHIHGAMEREINEVRSALNSYEQTAQSVPLEPVADADLLRLAPLLDQARALPFGVDEATKQAPSWRNLWLSQHEKLAAASRAVYRHALEWALLPRLIWRLEAQLRGNLKRPEFLYEATRVYLMLGSGGPLDRALAHEWMRLDWQLAFPGTASAPVRESLLGHLDALLADPLPRVSLDGELVVQARSAFAAVSMSQRVYSRIRPSAAAQHLPAWRPSDALGAAGAGLFVRSSGKPISDGIPGFFTVNGFHTVLLPSLADTVKEVAAESWVLGRRIELDSKGPQARALEHEVIAEYEADYAQVWDAMLADLNVAQQRSLSQAAQDLYILSSPHSPMRSLLTSIARELSLSIPAPGLEPASPRQIPAAGPNDNSVAMRLQSVLGKSPPQAEPVSLPPGHEIDERYRSLIDLVGNGPAAPIDLVLRSLSDMQQQLAKMAATLVSSGSIAAASGIDPALALRAQAVRQPQPLARWLTAIAEGGSALRSGNPRQQLVAMFNASGGPAEMCRLAADGHYPFSVAATQDTSLGDFSRLFAPGGLFDGFVNTLLRPYVDTSGRTWHLQTVNGVTPPISPGDLVQFQRAAAIRDAFFADGGSAASLRLDITPLELDAGASEVALDLDGTTVRYAHGPTRATQITWPGPDQTQSARLIFNPPPTGRADLEEEVGPWSIFRLFALGRLQQSRTPGGYDLTFQLGERRAVFEILAASGTSPFTPTLLQDFRCPAVK